MKKFIKWALIVLASLVVIGFIGMQVLTHMTKKHSPEQVEIMAVNDVELSVFYCSPSKKNRVIFGELVPYDVVWRTGANEASTFTTNGKIQFGSTIVDPGTYTLWTIPGKDNWKVILNSKEYGWGVDFSQKALREEEFDAAVATVPVQTLDSSVENFTIKFAEDSVMTLNLMWDKTKVSVPLEIIQ